jgi:catechol 2,3-dioxygenase-like lactoylglutathione lyase family enzyme
MDVQFITSVAVITSDPSVSRRLYVDALGLRLTAEDDGYLHSEDLHSEDIDIVRTSTVVRASVSGP